MIRIISILCFVSLLAGATTAQYFDFNKIHDKATKYTVAVNLVIEVSFGIQTTEAKSRGVGNIVGPDGLVMFDGSLINGNDPFSSATGMTVNAEPKNIEVQLLDGRKFPAEFVGVDAFTGLGFCRIEAEKGTNFEHVMFAENQRYMVGQWVATYMLLPEFVNPQVGVDVGLISAVIEHPEKFVLIVGFNEREIASVIYDSSGTPLGVLGNLENPALTGFDASQMMESFSQFEDYIPLLGIVDAGRLNRLIDNPPTRGKVDRGWLGIYLQALTPDIAEFWGIQTKSGIIINDVVKDSPADSAGLETGDIIIGLSGKPIEIDKEENIPIFQKQISDMGAGTPVELTILRRLGAVLDTLDISVFLTRAPLSPAEAPEYEDGNFEMKIRDMVFADYNVYNLDRHEFKAVVVKEVEPGGWAAVGGILPGDLIQSIDGVKTESAEAAGKALEKIAEKMPEQVIFFIWRDNKTFFINIKTDW
jgi:serine protease Do